MSISNSEKTQLDGGTVNAVSLDHRTGVITKGLDLAMEFTVRPVLD